MSVINKIVTVIILISALTVAHYVKNLHPPKPISISLQEQVVNINTGFLKVISLGNSRLISSLLWIKTLLDGDLEHYKGNDLNSWMFLRFKTITELDPKFYEAYLFGGLYLSIVKDDDYGAKYIYDKGIEVYPNDYELLKNIAFHYQFELNDILGASEFYRRLLNNPNTPIHYRSIYARFISEKGDLAEAFSVILETYEKLPENSPVKARLHSYLYAIKAEIDLTCLNEQKGNCQSKDLNTVPYIFNGKEYQAQSDWQPFRLKKKN